MKQAHVGVDIQFGKLQVRDTGGIPEESACGVQRHCGSSTGHALVHSAATMHHVSCLTSNSGIGGEQDENRQADV
jgi:hypothetical protein